MSVMVERVGARPTPLVVERRGERARVSPVESVQVSWLPVLALVGSLGLLLLAVAYSGARLSWAWSGALFWIGLLTLVLPIALRLAGAGAARQERLALVGLLGLGLYAVKLLHSPLGFTFSDEFSHARTAQDIVRSGRLFQENPLLLISPYFPGLELVTVALQSVGGLSLFQASVLVLAVGRLVHLVTLFLLFERAARSARIAGLATLFYLVNPNLLFFLGQYSYESLALPLATLGLCAAVRRGEADPGERVGLTLVAVLSLTAAVATHHLTGYAATGFLLVWTVVSSLRARRPGTLAPTGLALLTGVGALSWMLYIGTQVVGYLAPNLGGGVSELLRLIAGDISKRQLFRSFDGQQAPLLEQVAGYGAVLLILVALPFGLRLIWRYYHRDALAVTLGLAALAYPASLALRLIPRGAETSNRASEFLFVGVAFGLAVIACRLGSILRESRWRWALFGAWFSLLFAGGVVVGWAPWARLPGPYLVAADTRSVEPRGVAAAVWAREHLGPDNRVAADRINRVLMGGYGHQRPVTLYGDRSGVAEVFFAPEIGPTELRLLRTDQIRYLVVDARLSSGLPQVGVYFEQGEPNTFQHEQPIDPAALAKFDRLPWASRIFDTGELVIYDLGALIREP